MYADIDEGIDANTIYGSFQRDYPTFMPEESSQKNDTMIFPQRLDLSTLTPKKSASKSRKKKISPIKPTTNEFHKSLNFSDNEGHRETVDLDDFQRTFDAITSDILEKSIRKDSGSSVTSDRASSVSSTTSGLSQKSIFMQVTRAEQLINNKEKLKKNDEDRRRINEKNRIDDAFSNTDFHLTTDNDEGEEDNDTRPPSSQDSLAFEGVENPRRANSANQISSGMTTRHQKTSSTSPNYHRNAGTMSDTIRLSDTKLAEIYEKRSASAAPPICTRRHYPDDDEVTLTEHSPVKSIVDEVFEDYRSISARKETPILRSEGRNLSGESYGSARIECVRDATLGNHLDHHHQQNRSASMNNIMASTTMGTTTRRANNRDVFDGIAPGALRHSISTIQVGSQKKLQELQKEPNTYPNIPGLARFAIKPSTRDIFPLPLDIDAISGKGVRKDEKSTQRIFGGKTVATQIHGEKFTQRGITVPQKSAGATRPTTASTAKKVNFQVQNLSSANNSPVAAIPKPKPLTSNSHSNSRQPPPYCSATSSDGTAYSISTVTQKLLGTVKSLHPDWLSTIRRLLNESVTNDGVDVANEFRLMLHVEKETLEAKYKENRNDNPFEDSHRLTRITEIQRVLNRMEELGNGKKGGGHTSRIQQIKMIHSALLST